MAKKAVKKKAKPGPKLSSEKERKAVLSASVPLWMIGELEKWQRANSLSRSAAVVELLRRGLG